MKYKTLFALLLKAIGVLLLVETVPSLVAAAVSVFYWTFIDQSWSGGGADFVSALRVAISDGVAGDVIGLGLGLYLLLGGRAVVNLCIPSNRPYCPECGYDLSNRQGAECPECGAALGGPAPPEPAPRRQPPTAPTGPPPTAGAGGLAAIVPYRNRPALVGYYVAVASLIPVAGLLLGPIGLTLGIQGLNAARKRPEAGGKAHAWIAIVLGAVMTLGQLLGGCVLLAWIIGASGGFDTSPYGLY